MLIVSKPPGHQERVTPQATLKELGFDDGEIELLTVKHFKKADCFTKALWDLMEAANPAQLEKLQQIYPDSVSAYNRYVSVPGWYDLLITRIPQRRNQDIMGDCSR